MTRRSAANLERLAAGLLSRYCQSSRPPVDVEHIALELGIEVKCEPFEEDLSGVLVKQDGLTVIGVNSRHAITRQRFTIAHEIGHFVLKHEGELFVDKTLRNQTAVVWRDGKSSLGTFACEVQANQFAAELLMPRDVLIAEVEKRLERRGKSELDQLIRELASSFKVSRQAMEYRLTNLGSLIPA